jgi:hypothetical protein
MYKCLLSVLCPVRRVVTTLDGIFLKDSRLVLVAGLGPEISVRAWVSTGKTPPRNHMLVFNPAFHLSSFILPRDPQDWFRSNKLVNSCFPCEPFGNFISAYPSMSVDPKQSHRMLDGNVVQRLLALLYHWGRCSGSLKSFQNRLTFRTDTNAFLWSSVHLNFVSTGQDSKGLCLGPENCSLFS